MSLRANDALGFTKKQGVFSRLRLTGTAGDNGAVVEFGSIAENTGAAITPLQDGFVANVFTGATLNQPGVYYIEWSRVFNSGATRTIVLGVDAAPGAVPSGERLLTETAVGSNGIVTVGSIVIARGGETIRVFTSGAISTDASAFFRITKIA